MRHIGLPEEERRLWLDLQSVWCQGTVRLHNAKNNDALWLPIARFLDKAIHITRQSGLHKTSGSVDDWVDPINQPVAESDKLPDWVPKGEWSESGRYVTPVDNRPVEEKHQEALRTLQKKRQRLNEENGCALSKSFREKLANHKRVMNNRVILAGPIAAHKPITTAQAQMFIEQNEIRREKEERASRIEDEYLDWQHAPMWRRMAKADAANKQQAQEEQPDLDDNLAIYQEDDDESDNDSNEEQGWSNDQYAD